MVRNCIIKYKKYGFDLVLKQNYGNDGTVRILAEMCR